MTKAPHRKLSYVLLILASLSVWIAGCAGAPVMVAGGASASPVAAEASTETGVNLGPEVDPDVVAALNAEGAVTIIDVREDWEYETAGLRECTQHDRRDDRLGGCGAGDRLARLRHRHKEI